MAGSDLLTHGQRAEVIGWLAETHYPDTESLALSAVFIGLTAGIGTGSLVWGFGDMPMLPLVGIWLIVATVYYLGVKSSRTGRADRERGDLERLSDAQLICRLSDRSQQTLRAEGIDVDAALKLGQDRT